MSTTLPTAVQSMNDAFNLLKDAGFLPELNSEEFSIYGNIAYEPHKVDDGEFKPSFRDIFLGSTANGEYYVTSHIHGRYRTKRRRTWNDVSFFNIFASGKTPLEAAQRWLENWNKKQYNLPYQISK